MIDWIKAKTSKNRRVHGNFNFHIKSQPQTVDSSTTLILTAYSNMFQKATIPCVYRWSLIKNGFVVQRPEFKGSAFKCDPHDVGGIVQAEVISTDSEFGGTAVIHFGPVRLSQQLRKPVQTALKSGFTVMKVHIVNGIQERQCQIKIDENNVLIRHVYSQAKMRIDYSLQEPYLDLSFKGSNQLTINFKENLQNQFKFFKEDLFGDIVKGFNGSSKNFGNIQNNLRNQNNLIIKFSSRSARDIFAFVWKGFNLKKQLRLPILINRLETFQSPEHTQFDYLIQIQGLKRDLRKMDQRLNEVLRQKEKYYQEIQRLKLEIHQIVIASTKFKDQQGQSNMSHQFTTIYKRNDQQILKHYKKIQHQNRHLNNRIQILTAEIDKIRFNPKCSPVVNFVRSSLSKQLNDSKNMNKIKLPFRKKKALDDGQNFIGLLQDLQSSRISQISSINSGKFNPYLEQKLKRTQKEKDMLQKQLQVALKKINSLQNESKLNSSAFSNVGLKGNQTSKQLKSRFSFRDSSISYQVQPLKKTLNYQPEKHKTGLHHMDNTQLNNRIRFSYLDDSRTSLLISQGKNNLSRSSVSNTTEKKEPVYLEQDYYLIEEFKIKEQEVHLLKNQIYQITNQNRNFSKQLALLKYTHQQETKKLYQNLQSLQKQLEFYKAKSETFNQSQSISIETSFYDKDQLIMIKRQNEFLTNENQKISRACQKYMNEAKDCNKLRMELIKLKERLNNEKNFERLARLN